MTSTWDPKHEAELDRLLAALQLYEAAKIAALSPSDRAHYQGFISATCDVMAIFWIYIHGFDKIQKSEPDGMAVPGHILHWVHQNAGRSPRRLAGMTATHLCSTLEEFIDQLATTRLTPSFVRQLPRKYASGLKLKGRLPGDVRKDILRSLKPSVRASGKQWIDAVQAVFSTKFDTATEETLLSMIRFRNEYVHSPQSVMQGYHTTGEEMISWGKAVLLLGYGLRFGN